LTQLHQYCCLQARSHIGAGVWELLERAKDRVDDTNRKLATAYKHLKQRLDAVTLYQHNVTILQMELARPLYTIDPADDEILVAVGADLTDVAAVFDCQHMLPSMDMDATQGIDNGVEGEEEAPEGLVEETQMEGEEHEGQNISIMA
jgi:hypothetical protein